MSGDVQVTPWTVVIAYLQRHLNQGQDVETAAWRTEVDFVACAEQWFTKGDMLLAQNYSLLADMAHELSSTRFENCATFLSRIPWQMLDDATVPEDVT